jgi:hypothetical protein
VVADTPRLERRRLTRRVPALNESLCRVRSRTGHELDVVDLSDAGLLVEGRVRLLPNTHLDIHIITRTGRVLSRCRVVRASVWHLTGDLVRYRVGLAFDHRVDTSCGYVVHAAGSPDHDAMGTAYPEPPQSEVIADAMTQSA